MDFVSFVLFCFWDKSFFVRFTMDRLGRLERSLELALNQEWPQLSAESVALDGARTDGMGGVAETGQPISCQALNP
jgi:hypothetical protein